MTKLSPTTFEAPNGITLPVDILISKVGTNSLHYSGSNLVIDKLIISGDDGFNGMLASPFYVNRATVYSASSSFTIPTGVTNCIILAAGGGGGGGYTVYSSYVVGDSSVYGYGYGGSGGLGGMAATFLSVVAGTSYSFTVGAGGITSSTNGTAGSTTTVQNPSASTIITCAGGGGGTSGSVSSYFGPRNGTNGATGTVTAPTGSLTGGAYALPLTAIANNNLGDNEILYDTSGTNYTYTGINATGNINSNGVRTAIAYTTAYSCVAGSLGYRGTGANTYGSSGIGGAVIFLYYQ